MTTPLEVGKKIVELCRQGKAAEAVKTLYAPNVVSIEPREGPSGPARREGLAAVQAKQTWWEGNHEIHKAEAMGPWPHGDRVIVRFNYEVTPKLGPMAGKRMAIEEAALYTIQNGKVVQEEYFYHMD